jgi:hypothetical protein
VVNTSKRLVVAAIVAALAVPAGAGAPAGAATSRKMGPCQVRSLFSTLQFSQVVAIAGQHAPPGALDVELTCAVVRGGITYGRTSESAPGPVAVVGDVKAVPLGSLTVCQEIVVTYADRVTSSDTCP